MEVYFNIACSNYNLQVRKIPNPDKMAIISFLIIIQQTNMPIVDNSKMKLSFCDSALTQCRSEFSMEAIGRMFV